MRYTNLLNYCYFRISIKKPQYLNVKAPWSSYICSLLVVFYFTKLNFTSIYSDRSVDVATILFSSTGAQSSQAR